jgi:valyl-tRNA synthetase
MGMLAGRSAGYSAAFAPAKITAGRNFCNKLWNIARFIQAKIGDNEVSISVKPETIVDHWVLSKLQQSYIEVGKLLDDYRFSEAYDLVYHLVWDSVADWYIEASKGQGSTDMLATVLHHILILVHPFAPFVSETIWQTLAWEKGVLAGQTWEKLGKVDPDEAAKFNMIIELVTEIRAISSNLKIKSFTLCYSESELIDEYGQLIKKLANLAEIKKVEDGTGLFLTSTEQRVWLDIDHATAKVYTDTLSSKAIELKKSIANLQGRLANKAYVERAPRELVEQTEQELKAAQSRLETLTADLERFEKL